MNDLWASLASLGGNRSSCGDPTPPQELQAWQSEHTYLLSWKMENKASCSWPCNETRICRMPDEKYQCACTPLMMNLEPQVSPRCCVECEASPNVRSLACFTADSKSLRVATHRPTRCVLLIFSPDCVLLRFKEKSQQHLRGAR